jgi:hypothetical protein
VTIRGDRGSRLIKGQCIGASKYVLPMDRQPSHARISGVVEWRLRNPEGKKQGTLTQRVEVPDGELNGPWGNDATDAAYAAAQGILRLLRQ